METKIINGKKYYFGEVKNVCECCGTATYRAFYKGKKICAECIDTFEHPEKLNKIANVLLK